MILSVKERLMLLGVLPNQGDFTTLKIIRKMREDLSFSEEEHKVLNFQNDAAKGTIAWNMETDKGIQKDVALGEKAQEIIKASLQKLNSEKRLLMDHMDVYEKFCEGK